MPLSCLDDQKDTAKPSPALDGIRRDKRIMRHACRAVAVHRNATDCVEARRRDLTFPQPRAIVLPPPMVWRGNLCSLRQDRADGCLLSFKPVGLPAVASPIVGFLLFEEEI